MVDRTIIDPLEQMRDFDFVMFEHDVLVGMGALMQDVMSGLPQTIVAGLSGTQTSTPSLTINIASGRIYQMSAADLIATGSIPQDLLSVCQQGQNPGQTLTLVAPSAGQSQWNLVQAQFSQVDAVRANDPTNGVVPFYNVNNPSTPNPVSINTVRQGQLVLQVVSGASAVTGSQVPPQPTSGWVPLYLISLAGGQSAITTAQILRAGPSVGTGVSSNYPAAPFLGGLLAQHHRGVPGQSPKIDLTAEVTGVLPYSNMSPVRTLLGAPLTLYVNASTGNDANSGLSPSSPFLTIQAAINSAYHNYDFNGNALTVSVANGSYSWSGAANTYNVVMSGMPLGCSVFNLTGNPGSPGSVTLSSPFSNGVLVTNGCIVTMSGFTVTSSASLGTFLSSIGNGILANLGSTVQVLNCVMGTNGFCQLGAQIGSTITFIGPMTFTGTTTYSCFCQVGSFIYGVSSTVTVTGLTMSGAFVFADYCGTQSWAANTFIGSATGPRYSVTLNGVVTTAGGGVNYFPGNSAGSTSTGGQYA